MVLQPCRSFELPDISPSHTKKRCANTPVQHTGVFSLLSQQRSQYSDHSDTSPGYQKQNRAQSTQWAPSLKRNKWHFRALCSLPGPLFHSPAFCRLSITACAQLHLLNGHRTSRAGTRPPWEAAKGFSVGEREYVQQVCSVTGQNSCMRLHLPSYGIAIRSVLFWQVTEHVSLVLQASSKHKAAWFRCFMEEKSCLYNASSFFQYFFFLL